MNSLPSINARTVTQIKLAMDAWGPDAEFLATFVEGLMKITHGSGFGKVTVYVANKKVNLIRSEETHSFSDIKEMRFEE